MDITRMLSSASTDDNPASNSTETLAPGSTQLGPFASPPAAPTPTTTAAVVAADSTSPHGGHAGSINGILDPSQHLFSDTSTSPAESWRLDEFVTDPGYLAYQEELRCLIFNTAQTAPPTREATPEPGTAGPADEHVAVAANKPPTDTLSLGLETTDGSASQAAAAARQANHILATGRRLEYLKNYVGQVAPWLDMFDSGRAFGIQIPVRARRAPALLYAILALSARQIERKEGKQQSFDSLELYQEAIRLLTPLLQSRDPDIIPICTILCCLEMMSASAQDWRKHLEGCAALFDSFGIHGFSGGLLQAVFWCYARMDLCGALISEGTENTLLQPSKWLPHGTLHHESRELFRQANAPDMHANYAVYLCARVCELVADRTRYFELGDANGCSPGELTDRWVLLWEDLQAWNRDRPPELLPVQTIASTPFPQILCLHWAAISSNQLYHTACVLLLDTMPKPLNLKLGVAGSAIWHAKRICGISLTNPHQGCLNNAIQPLWVAGRLLSHKSEHELLVRLIRSIEAMTGWGTCWRIDDLESAWGYKVRKAPRAREAAAV